MSNDRAVLNSPSGLRHIRNPFRDEAKYTVRNTGIVYYVERTDGCIKIGTTHNYPARRAALVARHGPLSLVAWEVGSYALEHARHQQFAALRIDRVAEWFRPGDELIDFILWMLALS